MGSHFKSGLRRPPHPLWTSPDFSGGELNEPFPKGGHKYLGKAGIKRVHPPPSPLMETVHDFLMRIISEYYFSGPAEGKPCIFPFKFRQFEVFFGCTTDFPADLPGFIVEVDTEQCLSTIILNLTFSLGALRK